MSKRRAHSVGSAAAAAGVAPLTRVLSSVISSTMCLASAKTAAVTILEEHARLRGVGGAARRRRESANHTSGGRSSDCAGGDR